MIHFWCFDISCPIFIEQLFLFYYPMNKCFYVSNFCLDATCSKTTLSHLVYIFLSSFKIEWFFSKKPTKPHKHLPLVLKGILREIAEDHVLFHIFCYELV